MKCEATQLMQLHLLFLNCSQHYNKYTFVINLTQTQSRYIMYSL